MPIDRTNYNALVDDDGSNTIGSVWNKAAIKGVLLDPIDAAIGATAVIQTTTITGTQHNFALAANCRYLRCDNTALLTLTGLAAGYDGQIVTVTKSPTTAGRVDFSHNDSGSIAANRLLNYATVGPTTIAGSSQGSATYIYSAARGGWELRQHDQGTWIDVPYSAANFAALGSMTWTVEAGDQTVYRYLLSGSRTLSISFVLSTTSVGGTPANALLLKLPAGYLAQAAQTQTLIRLIDNGVMGFAIALAVVGASQLQIYTGTGVNFSASTNATHVMGSMKLEVQ